MKKLTFILVFILLRQLTVAQQLPLYSLYLYNKFLINPAHAGSDGYSSLSLTVREQWVGYSGAPGTCSLSRQTRILKRAYKLDQNLWTRLAYMTEGAIIANVRFKYVPKSTVSSATFIRYEFDYTINRI